MVTDIGAITPRTEYVNVFAGHVLAALIVAAPKDAPLVRWARTAGIRDTSSNAPVGVAILFNQGVDPKNLRALGRKQLRRWYALAFDPLPEQIKLPDWPRARSELTPLLHLMVVKRLLKAGRVDEARIVAAELEARGAWFPEAQVAIRLVGGLP